MSKHRLALLLAAIALLTSSFTLTTPSATAITYSCPSMYECFYYSDATYTVEVGYYLLRCDRTTFSEGTTTQYKRCVKEPCGCGGL